MERGGGGGGGGGYFLVDLVQSRSNNTTLCFTAENQKLFKWPV